MREPGRLLVIANRLPVVRAKDASGQKWKSSIGGLVTAMEPVLRERGGAWVGWTGTASDAPRDFEHNGIYIKPVRLSSADVEAFYHGFSNRTLWPLYHDAIRTPEFHRDWWTPYVEVNKRFAEAAAAVAQENDTVWVHDYQLQLVPGMLRSMRPDLTIGFFLHIPFPPEELYAWLPWRRQILEGLLGADVIGFQTYANAQNFSRVCRAYTTAEGTDTLLEFQGRPVRVGSYPISIDFNWFESVAKRPETQAAAAQIRRRIGNRKLLLAVDRLDYTKGIDTRLQAFGELLRRKSARVEDCVMMQIAVPSREEVLEYSEMRTSIEQVVGRINGEFSEPGRVAVHYFRRGFPREDIVAYYLAADVMVVTPLRDGMNLVAKEYVATRTDNSGVLVLSETAGAAREMRRALLVNPRDVDGMADAMKRGLEIDKSDARHRMSILRTVVRRHDVYEWANTFLEAMRT